MNQSKRLPLAVQSCSASSGLSIPSGAECGNEDCLLDSFAALHRHSHIVVARATSHSHNSQFTNNNCVVDSTHMRISESEESSAIERIERGAASWRGVVDCENYLLTVCAGAGCFLFRKLLRDERCGRDIVVLHAWQHPLPS